MTDAQRRYMKARQRVESFMLNPTTELLAATADLVADANQRVANVEEVMAQLRPVWAQGWTDEGVAASCSANALSELWQMLHATNQTQACENLRRLIADALLAAEYRDRNTVLEAATANTRKDGSNGPR